jgi:hypothetical protein
MAGISNTSAASEPYLAMPSGTVRINSTFPDGTSGVKSVGFGGSANLDNSTSARQYGFTNLLSWFSG